MYLVDTNIISEARRGERANPGVREFFATTPPDLLFLSALSIGELRRGVEHIRLRGDRPQAVVLELYLNHVISDYARQILDFGLDEGQVWGALMAANPHNPIDKQLAATALTRRLTVVTRNESDFAAIGVPVLNPFS